MTHGHELRCRGWGQIAGGERGTGQRGDEGNWDNCSNIINKIYLKKQNQNKISSMNVIVIDAQKLSWNINIYQLISQKEPCRQEGAGKKYSK